MAQSQRDVLVNALHKLDESSFKRFKTNLRTWQVEKDFKNIPSDQLEDADPDRVAELLTIFYKESYVQVAMDVLEAIDEKMIRQELQRDLNDSSEEGVYDIDFNSLPGDRDSLRCVGAYIKPHAEKLRLPDEGGDRFSFSSGSADYSGLSPEGGDRFSFSSGSAEYTSLPPGGGGRAFLTSGPAEPAPLPPARTKRFNITSAMRRVRKVFTSGRERPMTSKKSCIQPMECRLCGKVQDSAVLVTPVIKKDLYRLELQHPGLYHCQITGIKFLVKAPVTIEYKISSWSKYLKGAESNKHEILGPLFNMKKVGEPSAISTVYLPHHLCVKGFTGDLSLVKCAHFKNGNMILETPTTIEPFYITLENPTFSCLGVLLLRWRREIPIHGIVLIYFRILCKDDPDQEYRIHLYLLPHSEHAVEKLDQKKLKTKFQRIEKPAQTSDLVYTTVKYLVSGHPDADVCPKTLRFHSDHHSDPYQFTEINLMGNYFIIYLLVADEKTNEVVWHAMLTRGDIKESAPSTSPPDIDEGDGSQGEHFVDRHRQVLIEGISYIHPVLDDLLKHKLLTAEQYDTVRLKTTNQEKMRELYGCVRGWGHSDKDKLYTALKRSNKPLTRYLESVKTVH